MLPQNRKRGSGAEKRGFRFCGKVTLASPNYGSRSHAHRPTAHRAAPRPVLLAPGAISTSSSSHSSTWSMKPSSYLLSERHSDLKENARAQTPGHFNPSEVAPGEAGGPGVRK